MEDILDIIRKEKHIFTKEDLKKKLPAKKQTITDEIVDIINEANLDPDFNGDEFVDTMISYQNAMLDTKASIKEYVNAIKFCSYLHSTDGNITEAYIKARANDRFVKERADAKPGSKEYNTISSAASRFRKTPLVVKLLTQSAVPMYLMFQKDTYKAVGVLVDEMENAQMSRDRINAAKAVLEHIKPPENVQIELDIGVKENTAVQQLNDQLAQLASRQKLHLEAGSAELEEFGKMKPRDAEIIDVEIAGDSNE